MCPNIQNLQMSKVKEAPLTPHIIESAPHLDKSGLPLTWTDTEKKCLDTQLIGSLGLYNSTIKRGDLCHEE